MAEQKRRSETLETEQKRQKYFDRHYREVFGVEGERTESQRVVWDDFMRQLQCQVFRGTGPGGYDPIDAALAEGGRRLILQVKTRVERDRTEEQQKPEVKK